MQITTISIYQIFFGGVLCVVKTVWTMGLFKPLSLNITKEEIVRILEGLVDFKFQEIGPNWILGQASLVAQMVKCLPAMWEIQVQSLG